MILPGGSLALGEQQAAGTPLIAWTYAVDECRGRALVEIFARAFGNATTRPRRTQRSFGRAGKG